MRVAVSSWAVVFAGALVVPATAAAAPEASPADGSETAQPRAFEGESAVTGPAVPEPEPASASTPTPAPTRTTPEAATETLAVPPSTQPAAAGNDGGKPKPQRPRYPRLVLAGGPVVGPHSFGNEECRAEESRCETHGTFLGLGLNVELRARIYRPLYVHVRGVFTGNVSPRDPVHRGLYGGGLGFGAYGRRIFGRAEYLLVDTFGDEKFGRPFGNSEIASDRWGHHAGLFSVGARLPFKQRMGAELWGGFMVGPRSTRRIPDTDDDVRTLYTFLVGVNISYDLVPGKP